MRRSHRLWAEMVLRSLGRRSECPEGEQSDVCFKGAISEKRTLCHRHRNANHNVVDCTCLLLICLELHDNIFVNFLAI